jgi:hypothetical protein
VTALRGPAELLASLPRVLGRRPITAETVLLGWNDDDHEHAVAVTIQPDSWPLEQVTAVHSLVTDGATRCAVVVYTGGDANPTLRGYMNWLVAAAVRYGLECRDALIVHRHRDRTSWRSVDCSDPSCCPPEGNTLIEEPSTP